MKLLYSIPLSLGLLCLAGCGDSRKKIKPIVNHKDEIHDDVDNKVATVDIPVSEAYGKEDSVQSFFDDDIGEFAELDDSQNETKVDDELQVASQDLVVPQEYTDEFAWVEDDDLNRDFDVVYFDFDKSEIKNDQEEVVAKNVEHLADEINTAREQGKNPLVVVEGHSCSITRSKVYNFAKAETRAKVLADKLIEAGIPQENIKVVGRGDEYPAIVDGKQVGGTKEEQWPNRRAEVHLIYA